MTNKYPGRSLRVNDIPTILGVNKYQSKWELWQIVKGNLPDKNTISGRAKWAAKFAPVIIEGLQQDYKASLEKISREFTISSQTFQGNYISIKDPGNMKIMMALESKILITKQLSSENFQFNWSRFDNNIPDNERIKAQIQMMLSGTESCAFFLLIDGGAEETIIEIESDDTIASRIVTEVRSFIESIENDIEPEPNFATDGKIMSQLYPIDPEKKVDLSGDNEISGLLEELDLIKQRNSGYNAELKANKEKKTEIDAKLKYKMKTAQTALVNNNTSINIKTIKVGEKITPAYSYDLIKIANT